MRSNRICVALLVWVTGTASFASGQTSSPKPSPGDTPKSPQMAGVARGARTMLAIGGGSHPSSSLTASETKQINAEAGSFSSNLETNSAFGIDVAAGLALWRRLGVKVGYSTYSASINGAFQASVPHPLYFNKPRMLSGEPNGLQRHESAIDFHLAALIPAGRRAALMVSAGPTLLKLEQDVVEDFTYSQTYPYDVVSLGSVTTDSTKSSKTTVGGSVTLGFFLTKSFGIAAGLHYATGEVALNFGANSSTSVSMGGARGTFGFAARF